MINPVLIAVRPSRLQSARLGAAVAKLGSLGRMKVLVFGNSGSGKSTYARTLARQHLDLDSIVWEPGKIAVQRSLESVAASLKSFIDSHPAWVIEGCYGELVRAASVHCTLLVFLNPGIDACLAKQSQAAMGTT